MAEIVNYTRADVVDWLRAKLDNRQVKDRGGRVIFYAGESFADATGKGVHSFRVNLPAHYDGEDLDNAVNEAADYILSIGDTQHVWSMVYATGVSARIASERWECDRQRLIEAAAKEGRDLEKDDTKGKRDNGVGRATGDTVVGALTASIQAQNAWLLEYAARVDSENSKLIVQLHDSLIAAARAEEQQALFSRLAEAESKHRTAEVMQPVLMEFVRLLTPTLGQAFAEYMRGLNPNSANPTNNARSAQEAPPMDEILTTLFAEITAKATEANEHLKTTEGKLAVVASPDLQRAIWGLITWAEGAREALESNGLTRPGGDA
jgi:hypothetical protein